MRELYTLAPEQIDLERRTIFLRRTKNGKQRQVPMTSVAVELLRQHKAHSKQLFRYWSGTFDCKDLCNDSALLSIYFAKIFEQAGCPDLHFHDLRHEATSRLFERTTLREVEIMKITGHSSTKMLGRYANLRASNLATALW
jgi:integrase